MSEENYPVLPPRLREALHKMLPPEGLACLLCGERTAHPAVWMPHQHQSRLHLEVCCWICSMEEPPSDINRRMQEKILARLNTGHEKNNLCLLGFYDVLENRSPGSQ